MPIFDWIVSATSIITTKTVETFASEITKKWLTDTEKTQTLFKLEKLYWDIGSLQAYSNEFIDLLDIFVEKHKSRKKRLTDNIALSDFERWYGTWASQLGLVAISISDEMNKISSQINKLGLGVEIYLPRVSEILSEFEQYVRFDMIIPDIIIPKTSEYGIKELTMTDGEIISADELQNLAQKIRDSIETLTDAKKAIAEVVKKEFSFSDYMELGANDRFENNSFFSRKNEIERKRFYKERLFPS